MPTKAPFNPLTFGSIPFPGRRMSAGGGWTVVKKTANETQNNANGGTTARGDAELRFPIAANRYYRVRVRAFMGAIQNGTPDFETTFRITNSLNQVVVAPVFNFLIANYYATPNANTLTINGPTTSTPTPHTSQPPNEDENTSASGVPGQAEYGYAHWDVVFSYPSTGFFSFAWSQHTASVFFTIASQGNTLEWIEC